MNKKNVLFISSIFHNYEKDIIKAIEFKYNVTFFSDRKYGLQFSIINNFFISRFPEFQRAHYKNIIEQIKDKKIDILFVNRGYKMPVEFIENFKKLFPLAKLVMYQWDSSKNNDFYYLIDHFDKSFSFDYEDCANHSKLQYLANFITIPTSLKTSPPKIDFLFVGSFEMDRYLFLKIVKSKFNLLHKQYFLKVIIPPFQLLKLFKSILKFDFEILSIKKIKNEEYILRFHDSKCIIDYSSETQTGLSQRVVDALYYNKKIITNNASIFNEQGVNRDLVLLLKNQNELELETFINKPDGIHHVNLLFVNSWVDKIFESIL